MLIQNGIILHNHQLKYDLCLRAEEGVITTISASMRKQRNEVVVDAAGCYVLPGLIDIHTHGLQDILVQDGGWHEFSQLQLQNGVTACVPTLFAAPEATAQAIQRGLAITRSFGDTPNLLGFRLEMPYVAKPGAGLPSLRAPITPETTAMLHRVAEGHIRIWDVSPELPGAVEFIRWAKEKGIVTSLAHSAATIEQTRAAVNAGMTLVTHFYDTFDVAAQTDAGVYPAGLTDYIQIEDRLTVEIIPDGIHVHPLLVEKTFRCKTPKRIAFITDSVKGAGNPLGRYSGLYPGVEVEVTADRGVRRTSDDALSGSALTQLESFRNAVKKFGKSVAHASAVCSRTPARVLGFDQKGMLAPGMDADIIILDKQFNLKTTILRGQVVYSCPTVRDRA